VIHAGVYYAPGSLKARLCVQGARDLYEFCEEKAIPFERCGKVIVVTDPSELPRLDELERRSRANGVPGMRRLDADGIREVEPHASGIAGLHSPGTGIVDFRMVAQAFADDFTSAGGVLATSCDAHRLSPGARTLRIAHSQGMTEAGYAICCGGAWADRLAVASGADPDPRIVPFRGAYLKLVPERRHLVRSLIYPVPDPSLPFLGVHLTKRIDGEVLIGPTALLAGARDAYRLRRLRVVDVRETLGWPGSWRLFRRWWRTGLREMRHAASRAAFVAAATRYLPELEAADVMPSFAGIRAQAVDRRGSLVDDFSFSLTERALHVRNAPSPAATSSLSIARRIVDEAERNF
jgi:2-hydroxyglutarate dehydrogenase